MQFLEEIIMDKNLNDLARLSGLTSKEVLDEANKMANDLAGSLIYQVKKSTATPESLNGLSESYQQVINLREAARALRSEEATNELIESRSNAQGV